MADTVQTIFASPNGTQIKKEAVAGGAITPGNLLIYSGANVVVNATADSALGLILVADKNLSVGGATDTAYASGETVFYRRPVPGELVNLVLATSQTIDVGDELATATGGQVKAPAVAGTAVQFIAKEAVTTTAAVKFILAEVK